MIDKQLFSQKMTLLMAHFDKQLQSEVIALWKQELDRVFDDDEFTQAAHHLILYFEPRFKGHFPTVKTMVEVIQGSRETQALEAWQSVLHAASRNDKKLLAYVPRRGITALQAIGGLLAVGRADDYRRNTLKNDFVKVFCSAGESNARSLPQAQVVQSQPEKEEPAPMPQHIRDQINHLINAKGI